MFTSASVRAIIKDGTTMPILAQDYAPRAPDPPTAPLLLIIGVTARAHKNRAPAAPPPADPPAAQKLLMILMLVPAHAQKNHRAPDPLMALAQQLLIIGMLVPVLVHVTL